MKSFISRLSGSNASHHRSPNYQKLGRLGVSIVFSRGPFVLAARSESTNLDFLRSCAIFFVVLFHILLYFQNTHPARSTSTSCPWPFRRPDPLCSYQSGSAVFPRTPGLPRARRSSVHALPHSPHLPYLSTKYRCCCAHRTVSHPGWPPSRQAVFVVNLHATGILSNIFLLQDLTHTESAIAPLWSLPYEMRMYLLVPLIYPKSGALRLLSLFFGSLRSLQARALATQRPFMVDLPCSRSPAAIPRNLHSRVPRDL